MKNLNYLKRISLVILAIFTLSACSDDDNPTTPPPTPKNIVEIALETPELTALVAALQAADGNLVDVLQGPGPFTVLAPTNAAFTAFLNDKGFSGLDDVPTDVLAQILLNHVIMADVKAGDLIASGAGYASGSSTNSNGDAISIYFEAPSADNVRFNNAGKVTAADISASNGTIHIIDAVLDLPDVVDHAINNPTAFSSLVTALGAADGDLVNVLRGAGPFTVLAPDNAAFSTFLDGADLGSVDTAVLSQILLNHVISGSLKAEDLVALGAGYAKTSATGPGDNPIDLYFNTSSGVTFNGISSVFQADVVGTNGVIHAIDAVIGIPTVVTFVAADPNFSTLLTALTTSTPATPFEEILARTEVGSPADGINPDFTVFAPTNDAFGKLESIPGETVLTQVLLHHVISEANVTSGMLTNPGDTSPTMLNGQMITITLPGTSPNIADVKDGAGNEGIGIIKVDVQAGNGVIHVLDTVLLPALP
ncbi:fasciclin domain-containing protein [Cognatitamlana onchidii]|uniref:fasciclin domain-containing protein n=1 Tax=Cognatitamlana onchidii TaxID=2562860 RepID=UPI0010A5B8AF|nr:fasciclin domain-containing protein [Algibacter onchidii]